MKPLQQSQTLPRLLLTMGEPAGVGPELLVRAAQYQWPAELVALACPDLLCSAAAALNLPLELTTYAQTAPGRHRPGQLRVIPVTLQKRVTCGQLDAANAGPTLKMLQRASDLMLGGEFEALVTAPIHKQQLNRIAPDFAGHTEYFAARAGVEKVVMMLASDELRVALATTHLPLAQVAQAITQESLAATLRVIFHSLQRLLGRNPRVAVAGLNPHAGESGVLGKEEIEIIEPVIAALREQGHCICGPLPADTLFTPQRRSEFDLCLAMYHDQGLAVIKALSFGHCANVTLGLPYIRTSVDHGTALDIAATYQASDASIKYALNYAIALSRQQLP